MSTRPVASAIIIIISSYLANHYKSKEREREKKDIKY